MEYRKDIDCLRGISVLAVVFYHYDIAEFSGGFFGVDIFFVISGYLITSLILNDISKGNFSLIQFYERRIRRIFPALITVLLFTFILFNQIYLEEELKKLSQSILSSLLFYSNFYFLNFGSYFNPVNESFPLLHTWSLSIEEQFYLFFPILLVLFFKNRLNSFIFITIIFTILSFSLGQFGGNFKFSYPYIEQEIKFFSIPQFAFYFTLTRIWEILIGSLIAIYLFLKKPQYKSKLLTLIGYFLIFISFINFNKYTYHPSFFSLIPIIGTVLIILYSDKLFNKKGFLKIINNNFLLNIGLISYSLYLWHHPIYQFLDLTIMKNFLFFDKLLIIILVIFVSYLSYKFIEKPFRNKNFLKRNTIYSFYFIFSFIFIFFCFHNYYNKDYSEKYTEEVKKIYNHSNYYNENKFDCSSSAEKFISPSAACILGNNINPDIAIIGDSHLDLISIELEKKLLKKNRSAYQFSFGGCVPALNLKVYNDRRYNCDRYFNEVLMQIRLNPEIKNIFIFSRWPFNISGERFNNKEGGIEIGENHYFIPINKNNLIKNEEREKLIFNEIENFINEIFKMRRKIYIVMSVPEMGWEIPKNLARQLHFNKKIEITTLSISKEVYLERNKKVFSFFSEIKEKYNLSLIFLEDIFCNEKRCFAHKRGVPLYFDDDHMSKEGANLISQKIMDQL